MKSEVYTHVYLGWARVILGDQRRCFEKESCSLFRRALKEARTHYFLPTA